MILTDKEVLPSVVQNTPEVEGDFHASLAISPTFAAFLQIQFSESSMRESIEVHRSTASGDSVAPGMRLTGLEDEVIALFISGLERNRLELHGPSKSAAIMDVLVLVAQLSNEDVLNIVEYDILQFGNKSQKGVLSELSVRDKIFLKNELRGLAVMANAQFELNLHDDTSNTSPLLWHNGDR